MFNFANRFTFLPVKGLIGITLFMNRNKMYCAFFFFKMFSVPLNKTLPVIWPDQSQAAAADVTCSRFPAGSPAPVRAPQCTPSRPRPPRRRRRVSLSLTRPLSASASFPSPALASGPQRRPPVPVPAAFGSRVCPGSLCVLKTLQCGVALCSETFCLLSPIRRVFWLSLLPAHLSSCPVPWVLGVSLHM